MNKHEWIINIFETFVAIGVYWCGVADKKKPPLLLGEVWKGLSLTAGEDACVPWVCNFFYAPLSPLIISKFSTRDSLARKFFILGDVMPILEKSDNQRLTVLTVFPRCKRRLFVLQKTAFWSLKNNVSILQNNRKRNTKSRLLHGESPEAATKTQKINTAKKIFTFIHLQNTILKMSWFFTFLCGMLHTSLPRVCNFRDSGEKISFMRGNV